MLFQWVSCSWFVCPAGPKAIDAIASPGPVTVLVVRLECRAVRDMLRPLFDGLLLCCIQVRPCSVVLSTYFYAVHVFPSAPLHVVNVRGTVPGCSDDDLHCDRCWLFDAAILSRAPWPSKLFVTNGLRCRPCRASHLPLGSSARCLGYLYGEALGTQFLDAVLLHLAEPPGPGLDFHPAHVRWPQQQQVGVAGLVRLHQLDDRPPLGFVLLDQLGLKGALCHV